MSANGIGNSIYALQKVFWMTPISKLIFLGAQVCPTHIELF